MFPPARPKPKRVGGAPFSLAPGARRGPPKLPLSARTTASKPTVAHGAAPASAPGSARGPIRPGACRGDGSVTPLTRRAQEYYGRLIGIRSSSAGPDTRQDWRLVDEIKTLDHVTREEQRKRKEKDRNLKQQADLQAQLRNRHLVVEQCSEVWKAWRVELEEDAANFHKEEQEKRIKSKEVQRRNREETERQLEEARQKKVAQKEKEVILEREIMEKAYEAKRRQDEADEKRKREQKQAMLQVFADAEETVKRKKEAKAKERSQDIKDQQQFSELLDKQERERGRYFQAIRDKQTQLTQAYAKGVGNELAKLQGEDDERAWKHAEQKYEKEQRDQEERERWRKRQVENGKVAVQQQLALKANERRRQHDEDQRYNDQKRREGQIAEAKESEKELKKKEAVKAHAEFLLRQIHEKQIKVPQEKIARGQMNDVERSFNRARLERACDINRADGLPALLRRKREEYLRVEREEPTSLPC